MTSTNDRFAVPANYGRDLLDAARDNPVSTVLIGIGLVWMIAGGNTTTIFRKARDLGGAAASGVGASGRKIVDSASSLATSVSDAASTGFDTATDRAIDLTSAASEQVSRGSSSATSAGSGAFKATKEKLTSATDLAGDVAAKTQTAARTVSEHASDGTADIIATLRESFADLLKRRPLVLGALGLAVGAGVAAALPHIAAEQVLTDALGELKGSV